MTLVTTPWPHQIRGADRIAAQAGTLLAWEMGAGKSLAVVAHVDRERPKRVLILCPKSVIGVWPDEFDRHSTGHARVLAADMTGGLRKYDAVAPALAARAPVVVVTNHEAAWRDPLAKLLMSTAWDLVVVDESHRAKSPGGRFSRWLSRLRPKAHRRVALTGTPAPHDPVLDVYAQYRFLDPSIFGTNFTAHRARYCVMGGYAVNGRPVQVVGYQRREEFAERYHSIADTVAIEDVLPDLPDEIHVERYAVLPVRARRIYDDMEGDLVAELENGTVTAANAMVKVGKLQQIAAGAVRDAEGVSHEIHTAKADVLAEILADLAPSEPVAVFCVFRHSLELVVEVAKAAKRPVDELHGRANTVGTRWAPEPGAVAAIQYQSGGIGIDLTACRYVVVLDQTFRLGDHLQMIRRALRPGQEHHVTYLHLIARDTVDGRIRRALARRQDVIETILAERNLR